MSCHVNHTESRGRKHHRHFRGRRQVREQFCMPRVYVARGVQCFLVQRSCADRVDRSALGEFDGPNNISISRVAGYRRQHTPWQSFGNQPQIDAISDSRLELSIGCAVGRVNRDVCTDNAARFAQPPSITDDQWPAVVEYFTVSEPFHDHLWTDPGGVPHGDPDRWQEIFAHEFPRMRRTFSATASPSFRWDSAEKWIPSPPSVVITSPALKNGRSAAAAAARSAGPSSRLFSTLPVQSAGSRNPPPRAGGATSRTCGDP